jgi:hypothetical protein
VNTAGRSTESRAVTVNAKATKPNGGSILSNARNAHSMKLLIASIALFAASLLSLAFLPGYVVKDIYLHGNLRVLHLHLNTLIFIVLLLAAIAAFLFARFDFTLRVR